jgi:hypothetical protein
MEERSDTNYKKALAERSSHVENVLTHAFIASVAQDLWHRDPWIPLQVFQAEVDDAGFDLVLGCETSIRYIQIKQVHSGKLANKKFSIRLDFSRLAGSCVIVIVHSEDKLAAEHYLFFGSSPGEPMPSIDNSKAPKAPGRRSATGERKVRAHYREVSRNRFSGPHTIDALFELLFPAVCS